MPGRSVSEMGKPEQVIAGAIRKRGMTVKAVSSKTGIPYNKLQPTLSGHRNLRVDEFLALCALLKVDPRAAEE